MLSARRQSLLHSLTSEKTLQLQKLIRSNIKYAHDTLHSTILLLESSELSYNRRESLRKYFIQTRQRFIRLLVVVKWLRNASTQIEKIDNVLFTLEKSDRLYRRCADCLRPLALNVEEYLYPKWDVACAVHILRNQSYRLLPTTIEERAPLLIRNSADAEQSVLRRLSDKIRTQLLSQPLPPQFSKIRVANGVAFILVENEFEATVTLRMVPQTQPPLQENQRIKWHVVALRILIDAPQASETMSDSHRTQLVTRSNQILSRADDKSPLNSMYNFLHRFCVRLQMQMLKIVAEELCADKGLLENAEIKVETHRRLEISYWPGLAAIPVEGHLDAVLRKPNATMTSYSRLRKIVSTRKACRPLLSFVVDASTGSSSQQSLQACTCVHDPLLPNWRQPADFSRTNIARLIHRTITLHSNLRLCQLYSHILYSDRTVQKWQSIELLTLPMPVSPYDHDEAPLCIEAHLLSNIGIRISVDRKTGCFSIERRTIIEGKPSVGDSGDEFWSRLVVECTQQLNSKPWTILAILLNMCFHALSDHFVLMCEYSGYQCFRGSSLQLHGTLLNAVSRQSLFIRLKYDPRVFVVMRVLRETLIAFEIVRVKRRLGPLQAHSVVSLELDTILGDSQSLSRLRQALYGHAGDRTRRKVPSNALADDANQIISRFNEAAFKRLLSSCEIRAPLDSLVAQLKSDNVVYVQPSHSFLVFAIEVPIPNTIVNYRALTSRVRLLLHCLDGETDDESASRSTQSTRRTAWQAELDLASVPFIEPILDSIERCDNIVPQLCPDLVGCRLIFRYEGVRPDSITTLRNDVMRFLLLANTAIRIQQLNQRVADMSGPKPFPPDFFRITSLSKTSLCVSYRADISPKVEVASTPFPSPSKSSSASKNDKKSGDKKANEKKGDKLSANRSRSRSVSPSREAAQRRANVAKHPNNALCNEMWLSISSVRGVGKHRIRSLFRPFPYAHRIFLEHRLNADPSRGMTRFFQDVYRAHLSLPIIMEFASQIRRADEHSQFSHSLDVIPESANCLRLVFRDHKSQPILWLDIRFVAVDKVLLEYMPSGSGEPKTLQSCDLAGELERWYRLCGTRVFHRCFEEIRANDSNAPGNGFKVILTDAVCKIDTEKCNLDSEQRQLLSKYSERLVFAPPYNGDCFSTFMKALRSSNIALRALIDIMAMEMRSRYSDETRESDDMLVLSPSLGPSGIDMLSSSPALLSIRWCLQPPAGSVVFDYDRRNDILFVCIEFALSDRELEEGGARSEIRDGALSNMKKQSDAVSVPEPPVPLTSALGAARCVMPLAFTFSPRAIEMWKVRGASKSRYRPEGLKQLLDGWDGVSFASALTVLRSRTMQQIANFVKTL